MRRSAEFDEFVLGTARAVVAEVAPDEVAVVDLVGPEFLRDPDRVLAQGGSRAPVLGSGIDTVVTVVAPVALAVGASVYQHLLDKTGETLVKGGGKLVRRLFRRGADESAAVRRVVVARALELGRSAAEAERIADAVIAHLERDTAEPDDSGPNSTGPDDTGPNSAGRNSAESGGTQTDGVESNGAGSDGAGSSGAAPGGADDQEGGDGGLRRDGRG